MASLNTKPATNRIVVISVLCVLGLVVTVAAVYFAAQLMVGSQGHMARSDWLDAQNSARSSLIQFLGAVGLIGGLVFTVRTFALARQTQRSDRFAKALDQLGDADSEAIRVGGTYSLLLLADEAQTYWSSVEEVLTARVREAAKPGSRLAGDVQAALSVLGRRPEAEPGQRGLPLNLRGIEASGVALNGANFNRAYFDGAILSDSELVDAHLVRTRMKGANLDGADLKGADFTNATLRGATFVGAKMLNVVLDGADITDADFTDVEEFPSAQLALTQGTPRAIPNSP